MNAKAISAQSSKRRMNRGCLFIFGLVFFLAGLAAFVAVIVAPLFITIQAQSWREVPARILSSEIDESRDSDGTTYRADIKFEYEFENRVYTSNTWNTEWATTYGSHSGAVAAVKRFPAGSNHPCYLNPSKPERAVLDRSFQWGNLWGLFTLLFIIIGGAVMWGSLKIFTNPDNRQSTSKTDQMRAKVISVSNHEVKGKIAFSSESSNVADDDLEANVDEDSDDLDDEEMDEFEDEAPWLIFEGPQKLRPTASRVGTFVGILIAALFWNGISWFGFYSTIAKREWFAMLFLLIFVIIGAVLIVMAIYKLLQCFNPIIEVALSNGAVTPGETVDVAWETTGRFDRIRQLRLAIIGEEVVTYIRGTTTSTDRKIFQRIEIASVSDAESKKFGSASVTIPMGTIHSFSAPNNKIQWSIEVHGDIAFWPDIHETMQFAIKPGAGVGEQI
ncbi:MAG: DUF3592 domain-containing protein [Pirellulales bacterium]